MISNKQIKEIQALAQKKVRQEAQLFVVEGTKTVLELLQSGYEVESLWATAEWLGAHNPPLPAPKVWVAKPPDLARMSSMATAPSVLAVAHFKPQSFDVLAWEQGYILVLDGISDPGNLGTIIRIADWFGFRAVVCAPSCVELYNSKVIAAAMGSVFRQSVVYTELEPFLSQVLAQNTACYAANLQGSNAFTTKFAPKAALLVGSESHGISQDLLNLGVQPVTIPSFGAAESLNAGVAAGILCAAMRASNP